MISTFKWIYKLGYDNGTNRIVRILEQARDFHLNQEQIKASREYEERDIGTKHKITPKDHSQRRETIEDLLHSIDPEKYPQIDKFLELMQ